MILLYLAAGMGLLWFSQQPKPGTSYGPYQPSAKGVGTNNGNSPGQGYPFRPPPVPNLQNSNQPWYAGDRSGMAGMAEDYKSVSSILSSGSNIVHSLSDIWGQVSPGAQDVAQPVALNIDESQSYDWSSDASYDGSDAGVEESLGQMDYSNFA